MTLEVVHADYDIGIGNSSTDLWLRTELTIDIDDYNGEWGGIILANPNAPTSVDLSIDAVEELVKRHPECVVIIDEAYVDFGGTSALPLIQKYPNLLVTQTFSKSRSMAGARLGFGIACPELIKDLQMIRYSTNPYNVNSMSMAAGVGALADEDYFNECCEKIKAARVYFYDAVVKLGYFAIESKGNFVTVGWPGMDGRTLNAKLKENGVMARFLNEPRLHNVVRISIGTMEDMQECVKVLKAMAL